VDVFQTDLKFERKKSNEQSPAWRGIFVFALKNKKTM
jgi:hypothetical protein